MTTPLEDEVAKTTWYHTIELPGGVVTPGRWDTRKSLRHLPFPASLEGKRCLDVGSWDGFWAFEMEKRGAAEVLAVDISDAAQWDWPRSAPRGLVDQWRAKVSEYRAFDVAHRALQSDVKRMELSVYDLSPELVGEFDFVFLGSILVHLRDPAGALMALRSVVQGELLSSDPISLVLSMLRPWRPTADLAARTEPHWWTPNIAALKRLIASAGFEIVRSGRPYLLRHGPSAARVQVRARLLVGRAGVPHSWVLARPA
jgi:tRNA (mo5U34)-methyltransferase